MGVDRLRHVRVIGGNDSDGIDLSGKSGDALSDNVRRELIEELDARPPADQC